ncbi:hypothetical protein RhiirB3_510871 [Rhizophagus irregularis]|nr:hypothetical protein RhiirB3_510871 [Rhizophagus irregularis]
MNNIAPKEAVEVIKKYRVDGKKMYIQNKVTDDASGGHSTRQNYSYNDIDDDDENVYNYKKKDVSTWGENVETLEDEELPPPYDNFSSSTTTTFASINTTTTEIKPSLTISTSSSQQDYPTIKLKLNL